MPPKGKKGAVADKAKDLQDTEDLLQAVVLADSFETRFHPFTLQRPRCLLPLVNVPLIEYTLEFLANCGVDEVYVYCGAHTDQIEQYLQSSKWMSDYSPFTLYILRSTSRSIGDAMRDLDKRALLANDFIVVYGDVVSNLRLDSALAAHRARRAKDKNAIMTMVLRQAGNSHHTKAQRGASPVFVLDSTGERCLHYEQFARAGSDGHYIELDEESTKMPELTIRADLIDCGVDICTPDVLALWSDNFDYEAPRRGFLHSVLKDYELNGKTIHTHILHDHYAARVRNLNAYDAVGKDVVGRWAYPMTPDCNFSDGASYTFSRGNIYKEQQLKLRETCVIGPNSVVGRGSAIGDGTIVEHSIIGRNCSIGRRCIIEHACIWDNTIIDDDNQIRHSIIANDVGVGKRCEIINGALVSYGVVISDDVRVSDARRIVNMSEGSETRKTVGTSGKAFEFDAPEDEDEEAAAGLSVLPSLNRSISTDSISTLNSDASSELVPHHHPRSAGGSFISTISDDADGNRQSDRFHQDAAGSIYDSLQKAHDVSTIQLELQGLRMTANASEHHVRRAVVTGLTKYLAEARHAQGTKFSVRYVLEKNMMLIERTIYDKEAQDLKPDQVDFLLLAQTELAKHPGGDAVLLTLCNDLYLLDVLEEEAYEQWWEDARSQANEEMKDVRLKTAPWIKALAEAEEESSEEEGEEDDQAADDDTESEDD